MKLAIQITLVFVKRAKGCKKTSKYTKNKKTNDFNFRAQKEVE